MIPFPLQAREYAQYHESHNARYLEMASVPLLFLAFLTFLGFFHLIMPGVFAITLADIFVVGALIYYFRLNWILALAVAPIFIIFLWVTTLISYPGPTSFSIWAFVIFLTLGIVLHIVSHLLEGDYPSFITNLQQTLTAPMFLTAELFFLAGKMQKLNEDIHGGGPTLVDFEVTDIHVEKRSRHSESSEEPPVK